MWELWAIGEWKKNTVRLSRHKRQISNGIFHWFGGFPNRSHCWKRVRQEVGEYTGSPYTCNWPAKNCGAYERGWRIFGVWLHKHAHSKQVTLRHLKYCRICAIDQQNLRACDRNHCNMIYKSPNNIKSNNHFALCDKHSENVQAVSISNSQRRTPYVHIQSFHRNRFAVSVYSVIWVYWSTLKAEASNRSNWLTWLKQQTSVAS